LPPRSVGCAGDVLSSIHGLLDPAAAVFEVASRTGGEAIAVVGAVAAIKPASAS